MVLARIDVLPIGFSEDNKMPSLYLVYYDQDIARKVLAIAPISYSRKSQLNELGNFLIFLFCKYIVFCDNKRLFNASTFFAYMTVST